MDLGHMTFRNTSLIDYLISTPTGYLDISIFKTIEVDRICSDGQVIINFNLQAGNQSSRRHTTLIHAPHMKKWDIHHKDYFNTNLNTDEFNEIINNISNITNQFFKIKWMNYPIN
jgi:hypothetical protein